MDLFRAPFFLPIEKNFITEEISSLIINEIQIYLRFVLSSPLQQVDQIASSDCGIPLCRISRKPSYRDTLLALSSSSCKTPVPSSTRWTRARFVCQTFGVELLMSFNCLRSLRFGTLARSTCCKRSPVSRRFSSTTLTSRPATTTHCANSL